MPTPEEHVSQTEQDVVLAGGRPWFGRLSQTDFEIGFFESIVERSPRSIKVLRLLGELLARKGLYHRSMQIDQRLVELVPNDCVARYNLACSLAMEGAPRQALEELRRAVEQGYRDIQHLEVDPDLDSLRDDPAYQDLVRRIRKA